MVMFEQFWTRFLGSKILEMKLYGHILDLSDQLQESSRKNTTQYIPILRMRIIIGKHNTSRIAQNT
jgi:hypothetical protein